MVVSNAIVDRYRFKHILILPHHIQVGPHQAYGNLPRSIEAAVDWISHCIKFMNERDYTRIEPTAKGVQEWTQHVHEAAEGLLSNEIDSWM